MFPPVDLADEDGLLCYGGDLSVATLTEAYHRGIFPWPHDGCPLLWFAPPRRGLLFLDEFHLSRRSQRAIRNANYACRIDSDFAGVVHGCAERRQCAEGTWITTDILDAYCELHRLGVAHSVETYQDGHLVGGLYGVSWGGYFCGESMFHREDDASKAALAFLVEHLQGRGVLWIDCQLLNPLFETLGAREVLRHEYVEMLSAAIEEPLQLFD